MEIKLRSAIDSSVKLDVKDLKKLNPKLIIDIQGLFEIEIENTIFFREPSLALLELAVACHSWNFKDKWEYFTLEHDEKEGPILAFMPVEGEQWRMYSIWQQFEMENTVHVEKLRQSVETFLRDLDKQLQSLYDFTIEEFMKGKRRRRTSFLF